MGFYPHGIRRGSPGYELEDSFDSWLYECEDEGRYGITNHVWPSEKNKTVFDFIIYARGYRRYYVDIVGYYYQDRRIKLVTGHKNWTEMLDYAKNEGHTHKPRCHLAFDRYGEWEFLKITEELPTYDIYLSKNRIRGIRTADTVFNKIKRKRYPLTGTKYLFNRAQMKAVNDWIGST